MGGKAATPAAMEPTHQTDDRSFNALELRTLAFCFVLNMLNGADVLVVSYVAPVLAEEWGTGERTLGLLFSAGLAGMMLGALALGPLSDLFGRRAMILWAGGAIAVGMAASGLATDIGELVALRFGVGLGIGSMLASVTAMAAEYAPKGFRALAVTVAAAGFPLGAIAVSLTASATLPVHGWAPLFLVQGGLSALMAPICLRWMPESVEFLLTRQPRDALRRANRILLAMGKSALAAPPDKAAAARRPSPVRLLERDRRVGTLLVWAAFFGAFMTLYFLLSWIPTLAVAAGLSIGHALYAGAAYHLGSIAGHVALGWLSLRFGLFKLVAVAFGLSVVLMPVVGAAQQPTSLFVAEIFLLGALAQGGFGGLYAAAARLYPTEVRATGIGWALGTGRLGAVIGPFLGGLAIGWGAGRVEIFALFALPLIAAAVAAAALGLVQARRSAD